MRELAVGPVGGAGGGTVQGRQAAVGGAQRLALLLSALSKRSSMARAGAAVDVLRPTGHEWAVQ